MHKVFISYHHANDQYYKDQLVRMGEKYRIFIDRSVDTGDISETLKDEVIREKIRDEYLRDSTVTIVLVGQDTKGRKHVDWEIYSSMIDGKINKKSGILVVNLPSVEIGSTVHAPHYNEKTLYPNTYDWTSITSREQCVRSFPYAPDRIIDNLMKPESMISVTRWSTIESNSNNLGFLVEAAFQGRAKCEYDLSQPMRKHNSPTQ